MKLHNYIPSRRDSPNLWRRIPSVLLLSTSLIHHTNALSYPTTIEIDILFPLPNKTYPNITSFPVIFTLQNIPAANEFGYTISWDLRSEDDNSTIALGTMYKMTYRNTSDSSFLFDDGNIAILPDTAYNSTRLKSGRYAIKWKYSMVTCSEIGDRTQYNIGGSKASNSHSFRIEEKEVADTAEVELGLDAECPAFGDVIVVKDATKGGCPFMAGSSAKEDAEKAKDPCRAKLNAKQASCIQGNVTGTYNESLCREAFGSDAEGRGSENGAGRLIAERSGMFGLGVVGLIATFVLL